MTKPRTVRSTPAALVSSAYDPLYDPLHHPTPGEGRDYAPTYWIATAGEPPEDDGPLNSDLDVDVAVIGAGYTGLSCAAHLAKDHGVSAVVLEANRIGWGCSSRNGGQAQMSAGRLKRSQWIQRWGLETAKKLHVELEEAFDLFRSLISTEDFDCDPIDKGHIFVAHRQRMLAGLTAEAELLKTTFGWGVEILSRNALREQYFDDAEAFGALFEPDGIGVHAAKLAFGHVRHARRNGARVFSRTPVTAIKSEPGRHLLITPRGTIRAKSIAFATGGYSSPRLHSSIDRRLMPILSNSLVTRPLSSAELKLCGFRSHVFATDTRKLRFYYRLLPDNRLQIGSRSAICGADADNPKHLGVLLNGMHRKFPHLKDIAIDYSWWGWVDVSHDMMPRIFQPDAEQSIYYALGYGGNGVMYSAQAGRRLAALVARKPAPAGLPIFSSPLPDYGVLTPFRRLGQRGFYVWHQTQDERP